MEVFFYSFNLHLFLTGATHITDPGGTYSIHMFGAFFGLTCVYVLGKPKSTVNFGGGMNPDLFSLMGTIFLWIYWPSFNGGIVAANSAQQQRAIINTVLSLSGSVIASFCGSQYFSASGKFRPVDIQNATLAGGAAIGAVCLLTLSPGTALLIGTCAGAISSWGFNNIAPIMESYGIYDNCGIVNLHCIPSLIGATAATILAAYKTGQNHEMGVYFHANQWFDQLFGAIITIAFAVATGGLTGTVMKWYQDDEEEYVDEPYWEVVEEHENGCDSEKLKLALADLEKGVKASAALSELAGKFAERRGATSSVAEKMRSALAELEAAALFSEPSGKSSLISDF